MPDETGMETTAAPLTDGTEVERDESAREFETRLVESSTLAFRVAYSVLRQCEDAEEVAQEAFTRAPGPVEQLRAQELWHAIDALPPKLRMVVVLANIERHGMDEVAALLASLPGLSSRACSRRGGA